MGGMVTHSTSMTDAAHFHNLLLKMREHAEFRMNDAACESMSAMLCLMGEDDIDAQRAVSASLEFLDAWWTLRRCDMLIAEIQSGKAPEVLESELPESENGRRDREVWLGWMKERHPGLSGDVAEG